MNLIEAFEKVKVNGFYSPADQVIESAISKLFFYGNRVFKVYKCEKYFFGDFSSPEFRREFYQEDFHWNHVMAPEIYTALKGVEEANGVYKRTDLKRAKDFYIEMRKVDASKNLTNLLGAKQVSPEDLEKITIEMALRVQNLSQSAKEKLRPLTKRGLFDLLRADLKDIRQFAYTADPKLPKAKSDEVMDALEDVCLKEEYFKNFDSENLSIALDNHSDNILFLQGSVEFIDIMPPKENWRVTDPYYNICRPATDVTVISGPEGAEAMYQAYEKIAPGIPNSVKTIYEIRSSMIRAPYFYILDKPDLAQKYLSFAESKLQTL